MSNTQTSKALGILNEGDTFLKMCMSSSISSSPQKTCKCVCMHSTFWLSYFPKRDHTRENDTKMKREDGEKKMGEMRMYSDVFRRKKRNEMGLEILCPSCHHVSTLFRVFCPDPRQIIPVRYCSGGSVFLRSQYISEVISIQAFLKVNMLSSKSNFGRLEDVTHISPFVTTLHSTTQTNDINAGI